ncbi:MAG: hypothetical protein ACOYS2_03505 [Patescibacteria group bacterium]
MSLNNFKTERILLASIVILSLFIFVSAFSKEMGTKVSLAEEESDSGSGSKESSDNESSGEDEDSQEESREEEVQDNEQSEPSTSLVPSVQKTQTTQRIQTNNTEVSEKSLEEASQRSTEEMSEVSEPSEKLEEISEESIKYVEGYGNVVSEEGNVALVKKDEKLFFLIPVEVESQVTLDEQGNVTDSKKSFLNWLLSVFSF